MNALLPYFGFLLNGLLLTAQLAIAAAVFAFVLGLVGCFARVSNNLAFRCAAKTFATLFRSLPELLSILFAYYGLQLLLQTLPSGGWGRLSISPFVAATIALSLHFAAYSLEIFHDALQTVPKGMVEAGQAIGLTHAQVRWRILLPLLLRAATPALCNLFLVLFKFTSLASVIGLEELVRRSTIVSGSTHLPLLTYSLAASLYLIATLVCLWLLSLIAAKHLPKTKGGA